MANQYSSTSTSERRLSVAGEHGVRGKGQLVTRLLTVAAAQLGPIAAEENRRAVVRRCVALMEEAARAKADIVVYPEAALTPFFPHWLIEDETELDSYFEADMPNADVQPLFDAARRLGIGFHLGYCELA
ncbi:MAG: nitrilase-related carbon-nitrogen hydrolase, partial [Alphaproteobacteria bacterium]